MPFTIMHPEVAGCAKSGEITRGIWVTYEQGSPVDQYNLALELFQAGEQDKAELLILCPGCHTPYHAVENQKTNPKTLEP
jgi:hypothetical protein